MLNAPEMQNTKKLAAQQKRGEGRGVLTIASLGDMMSLDEYVADGTGGKVRVDDLPGAPAAT